MAFKLQHKKEGFYSALHYETLTKTESIDSTISGDYDLCENIADLNNNGVLQDYQATHVVASITYGGDAHIIFKNVGKNIWCFI